MNFFKKHHSKNMNANIIFRIYIHYTTFVSNFLNLSLVIDIPMLLLNFYVLEYLIFH